MFHASWSAAVRLQELFVSKFVRAMHIVDSCRLSESYNLPGHVLLGGNSSPLMPQLCVMNRRGGELVLVCRFKEA